VLLMPHELTFLSSSPSLPTLAWNSGNIHGPGECLNLLEWGRVSETCGSAGRDRGVRSKECVTGQKKT